MVSVYSECRAFADPSGHIWYHDTIRSKVYSGESIFPLLFMTVCIKQVQWQVSPVSIELERILIQSRNLDFAPFVLLYLAGISSLSMKCNHISLILPRL